MTHYPNITTLVNSEAIPGSSGIPQEGIQDLLAKTHYHDFIFERNQSGDGFFCSIVLVWYDEIGFDFPGLDGLGIVLNPSDDPMNPGSTEVPLNLFFKWGPLGLQSLDNFSNGPEEVFNLLQEITNVSPNDLFHEFITNFFGSLQDFVDYFNPTYTASISLNTGLPTIEEQIADLISQILGTSTDLLTVIFDFLNSGSSLDDIISFFSNWLDDLTPGNLLEYLLPDFSFELEQVKVGLKFPLSVLKVVDEVTCIPIKVGNDFVQTILTFTVGSFEFSSENGFVFENESSFDFPKSEILNTGLSLGVTGLKVDLSRKKNIPEATADGRPPDFVGAYILDAVIGLPPEWTKDDAGSNVQIYGNNLLIGTGGISGTIGLKKNSPSDPNPPLLKIEIGDNGFEVGLSCFDMTFHQNSIVETNICGYLKIPGFKNDDGTDAEIDIDINIDADGNFMITASVTQDLQVIKIPNILSFSLNSLFVGKRDDRYFVGISGNLDFDQKSGAIGQFLPKDVEITKMLIWSDGTFEFEGGALVLPKAITLPIGPVKISITALHLGSDERNGVKYKYVGFDGGISINPGGVDARGDGIKYYFTEDGSDHFFRIEGIGIDLVLPGNVSEDKAALLLSGYLAVKEGGANGVEYAGSVAFSLPKLNIGGSAGMRYIPETPAFLVNVGLELSNPIPLGSTGLGIYGFEALFGRHFVVSKSEAGLSDDTPWFEYYKMPDRGINNDKFYPIGGTSLGAGVLFGTSADSGFTFSSRLFFLLSLPGVFFLEGEAQLLKKRIGFVSANTPPFYAFLAITDSSIEAALGVDYKLPDSGGQKGDLAEVTGALELGFFFGNSTGWYVNIGRDLPESKRIQAKLLRVINRAYFYFMLSASGIRTGAGAGMKIDKKFGPARVKVEAYLDLAGRLSFRPLQVGGSIRAGIEGSVSIFGVGIGIGAHFALSVDAPKPFIIAGEVKVCVKLLFVKKCAKVKFKWTFNQSLNVIQIPLLQADSVNAINVHTGESYPVAFDSTPTNDNVIPLDSFVDIEFKHAINPLATSDRIGGITETPKYRELLPPRKSKAPQLTYEFEVTNVTLSPDNVYDIPGATIPGDPKIGFWQWNAPGHYTKIRLLSLSPLSFMSNGVPNGPSWSEDYAVLNMNCVGTLLELTCIDLNLVGNNGLIPSQSLVTSQGVGFQLSSGSAGTVGGGSIQFNAGQDLTIYLSEPTVITQLSMGTDTDELIVKYYQLVADSNLIYSDVLVQTDVIPGPASGQNLEYSNPNIPIQKIVIESGTCTDRDGGGGATPKDLPCTPEVMADLVGLINGLHKARYGILKDPLQVNTSKWMPLLYKYLVGDTFNMCTTPKDGGGTGDLLNDLLNTVPEVVVTYLPFNDYYGQYKIEIVGCATFYVKFFLSNKYLGEVLCFECLKFPGKWNNGLFYFTGEALLSDGKTRIPIRGCINVEFAGDSSYSEPEECKSELNELCYQTLSDYQYNETVIETNSVSNTGDDVNAINSTVGQVLWKPNTTYTVNIGTSTKVLKDGVLLQAPFTENHAVKFKTAGPPGFFHQFDNSTLHPIYDALPSELQDKFKLKNLLHYIDFATSYPNADGNLINAKPIFYENVDLGLFFKQAYIRTMYDDAWGGYKLGLRIKDPAKPAEDADVTFAAWVPGPVIETIENTVINEMLGEVECLGIETVETVSQGSVFVKDLEPLKCYTAVYDAHKGAQSREVHRYTFETSRYASFAEQVNSYVIEDPDDALNTIDAVFLLERDWGGVSIPASDPDNVLAYEQALFGTLGLSDLPPATTTEFLILKDSGSMTIVGVLVRNPEPFNDPKIPVSLLEEGIDLQVNGVNLNTKIVAKDSSAILFPNGGNFPATGTINIAAIFRYKVYNPDTGLYENSTTESVIITKQL